MKIEEESLTEEDVKIEAIQYLADLHTALYEYHKDLLNYANSHDHIRDIGKMFEQKSTEIKSRMSLVKESSSLTCQTYTIGKTNFQMMLFTSEDLPNSETHSK